ncbi:cation:proton antiporter [Spongiivirga citrea]|uniref:Cell shape-determining protein n=1 Tax=Spongiivirga citrea TaxID=1481457 RepID=A0A6M0CNE1_9FLAO|nr:sodium:proton antiporter [Spongiivirga citrea]NER17379.1 cell shape-determining protein [Spongiivirga citrea]
MLELGGIIILGILAQWVAWKFKIPAILPLILIGLLVGPFSTLFSVDGTKWIEPIWDGNKGLFPGEGLFHFVSLAIGIILFEGGLTLKRSEISKVGPVIVKLISLGSLITFIGSGVAAHYIFGLNWQISLLFAGLIIVTGPTVISPILRNIPLKKDVSAVLKWEGILIDPIGALVAVLVFEFISVGDEGGFTKQAFIEFGKIVLIGFSFGISAGYALYWFIKKKWIPHYLLNVATLSVVLLVFVESDLFAHESGLLAVVVMGMFLGNSDVPSLKELLYFKESLSVLLISILFILLAANINIEDLLLVYNWNTAILLAVVIFIIRPIGVFLSTQGSGLKFNEKLFISWVGPRGIVAAGIASLFGSKLVDRGEVGAEYITPLVFTMVLGTVLLNATTARLFAKLVGVFLTKSEGILIVGASNVSRLIGKYLNDNDRHVVLIDSNNDNIERAKAMGLDAAAANVFSDDLQNDIELSDIGYLLALTGSAEVNKYAINRFAESLGEHGAFRLVTDAEMKSNEPIPEEGLFCCTDDYLNLSEVARDYPKITELAVGNQQEYSEFMLKLNNTRESIPLFIMDDEGVLHIISSSAVKELTIKKGFKIVYLGMPLEIEVKEEETAEISE